MTDKIKISPLSIVSLVFGLLFFIPLVSGVIAVLFGLISKNNIKKSQGSLLGNGLALSGIILGGLQLLLWSLFLFTDMTYVVKEGQEAVILRSDHPVRLEEPGIHFKIPFLEEIEIYPVGKVFSYKVKGIRVISRKKERMHINASLDWKVCNSLTAYKYFNYFEESRITGRIYLVLDEILKRTATEPDISNVYSLVQDYEITLKIEKALQKRLDGYGICIYGLKLESTNEQQ